MENAEQTLETQTKEVEMVEEQVAEQPQAPEAEQPAEAAPEPEPVSEGEAEPTSEGEVSPEPETREQRLAANVRARLAACTEDSVCVTALSRRFSQVAKGLGILPEQLLDHVFDLLEGKKTES